MVAAYFVGLPWGIVGVAAAYTTTVVLLTIPALAIALPLIGLPLRELGKTLLPHATATAGMAVVVGGWQLVVGQLSPSPLAVLLSSATIGALVYGVYLWHWRPPALEDAIRILPNRRRPRNPIDHQTHASTRREDQEGPYREPSSRSHRPEALADRARSLANALTSR